MKTLQTFAAKNSSAAPSIQAVTVSKRKKIVLLSNGSEFLYLVIEDSIVVSAFGILICSRGHKIKFPPDIFVRTRYL